MAEMTTRELFEAEFPVPDGVVWNGYEYAMEHTDYVDPCVFNEIGARAFSQNQLWIGFQAGYKAKEKEDA